MIMNLFLVIVGLALLPFAMIGLVLLIGVSIAVLSAIISLVIAIIGDLISFLSDLFGHGN